MADPEDANNNHSRKPSGLRGLADEREGMALGRRSLRDRRARLERREQSLLAQEKKHVSPGLAANADVTGDSGRDVTSQPSSKVAEYLATTDELLNGTSTESVSYSRQSSSKSGGSNRTLGNEYSEPKVNEELDTTAQSLLNASSILSQDDISLSSKSRNLAGESSGFSSFRKSLPTRIRRPRREVADLDISTGSRTRPVDRDLVDQSSLDHLSSRERSSDQLREQLMAGRAPINPASLAQSVSSMTAQTWEQLGETKQERMERYKQQRRQKMAERVALITAEAGDDLMAPTAATSRWGQIAAAVTGNEVEEKESAHDNNDDVGTYLSSRRRRDRDNIASSVVTKTVPEEDEVVESVTSASELRTAQLLDNDDTHRPSGSHLSSAKSRRHRIGVNKEEEDVRATAAFSSSSSTTSSVNDMNTGTSDHHRLRIGAPSLNLSSRRNERLAKTEAQGDKVASLLQESIEKLSGDESKPASQAAVSKERGKESSGYSTEEAEGSASGDVDQLVISDIQSSTFDPHDKAVVRADPEPPLDVQTEPQTELPTATMATRGEAHASKKAAEELPTSHVKGQTSDLQQMPNSKVSPSPFAKSNSLKKIRSKFESSSAPSVAKATVPVGKVSATINRLAHQEPQETKKGPKKTVPTVKADVSNLLKKFDAEPKPFEKPPQPHAMKSSVERRREKLNALSREREAEALNKKSPGVGEKDKTLVDKTLVDTPAECNNNDSKSLTSELPAKKVSVPEVQERPADVRAPKMADSADVRAPKVADSTVNVATSVPGVKTTGRSRVRHRGSISEEDKMSKVEIPQPKVETPQPKAALPQPKVETPQPKVEAPQPKVEVSQESNDHDASTTRLRYGERERHKKGDDKPSKLESKEFEQPIKSEKVKPVEKTPLVHHEPTPEKEPSVQFPGPSLLKKSTNKDSPSHTPSGGQSTEWNTEVVNALLHRSNKIDQQIKDKARPEFKKASSAAETNVIDGAIADEKLSSAMRRRREFNGEIKGMAPRQSSIKTNAESGKSTGANAEPPLDPQLANLLQARRKKDGASKTQGHDRGVIDTGALMREKHANRKSNAVERSTLSVAQRASFFLEEQQKLTDSSSDLPSSTMAPKSSEKEPSNSNKRRWGGARRDSSSRRSDARFQTQPVTQEEVMAAAKVKGEDGASDDVMSRSDDAAGLSTEEKLQRLGTFTLEEKLELFAKRMFFPCELKYSDQSTDDGATTATSASFSPGKKGVGRYMTQPVSAQDIRDAAQYNVDRKETPPLPELLSPGPNKSLKEEPLVENVVKDAPDGAQRSKKGGAKQVSASSGSTAKSKPLNVQSRIDSGLHSNRSARTKTSGDSAPHRVSGDHAASPHTMKTITSRRAQAADSAEKKLPGSQTTKAKVAPPDNLRLASSRHRPSSARSTPEREAPSTHPKRAGISSQHSRDESKTKITTPEINTHSRSKLTSSVEGTSGQSKARNVKAHSVDNTLQSKSAAKTDNSTNKDSKRSSLSGSKSLDTDAIKESKVKFNNASVSPKGKMARSDSKSAANTTANKESSTANKESSQVSGATDVRRRGSAARSSFRQKRMSTEDSSQTRQKRTSMDEKKLTAQDSSQTRSGRRSVTPRREVDLPSYMKSTKSFDHHVDPIVHDDDDVAMEKGRPQLRSRSSTIDHDEDEHHGYHARSSQLSNKGDHISRASLDGDRNLSTPVGSKRSRTPLSLKDAEHLPSYMKPTTSVMMKDRQQSQDLIDEDFGAPTDGAKSPTKPKAVPVNNSFDVPNFMKATESYFKKVEHLIDAEETVQPVVEEKKKVIPAIPDGEVPNFLKPTKNYQNRLDGTEYIEEVPEIKIPARTHTPVVLGANETPSYMRPTTAYERSTRRSSQRDSLLSGDSEEGGALSDAAPVSPTRTKGAKERQQSSESLLSDRRSKKSSVGAGSVDRSSAGTPSYMRPTSNSSHRVESSDQDEAAPASQEAGPVTKVTVDGEVVTVPLRPKKSASKEELHEGRTNGTSSITERPSSNKRNPQKPTNSRLAQLQKKGDEGWKKRVTKEATDAPTSIHNRLTQMQANSTRWQQKRGAENDAVQFSVEGRMQSGKHLTVSESPLHSRADRTAKKPGSLRLKKAEPMEKSPLRARNSLPVKKSAAVDTPSPEVVEVELPQMDDMSSFFISKDLSPDVDDVGDDLEKAVDAFNDIFIESAELLPSITRIKPQRTKPSSQNPLKALNRRTDLKQGYTQVTTGVAQREAKRLKAIGRAPATQGLHTSALAGLATKTDLKGVQLRKMDKTQAVVPGTGSHHPFKEIMLLQIKGRRFVQTRLVEPVSQSVNSGDCFILVTKKRVFHWIGEFSNLLERSRSTDLAAYIISHHDLGCKMAKSVTTIREVGTDHGASSSAAAAEFWGLLGGDNYGKGGPAEEDQLYESYIMETNKTFRVEGEELQPVKDGYGEAPLHSLLKSDETLIFDFGSELYVWYGKQVAPSVRKVGLQMAEQLYKAGYDFTEFDINPLAPLALDPVSKTGKNRPNWTLFGKVSENMETCLFREKFFDWPDSGKIMEQREMSARSSSPSGEEIKAVDADTLLDKELPPVTLVLENSNVGRGTYWMEYEDGLKREYEVVTEGACVWHTLATEYFKLPEKSFGHFHSGDSYVVKWQYRIRQIGIKTLKGHESKSQAQMGRARCAYFFWQGANSSINEKGASALMTIDLDEEKGPHIRVEEGLEPPCFFNLFDGQMVVHHGKRDEDVESRCRLYAVLNENANEACLREVDATGSSLRSRTSFILLDVQRSNLSVWHGTHSPQSVKTAAWKVSNALRESKPSELSFGSSSKEVVVTEMDEGAESMGFLRALKVKADDRSQYDSLLGVKLPVTLSTPRLFFFESTLGQFTADEIPSLADPSTPRLLPFCQSLLYNANQPALFFLDTGLLGSTVYLWQGWWPKGEDETDNVATGSASARFSSERRAAMETIINYCKIKYSKEKVKLLIVHAGHEPIEFTNHFSRWVLNEDVASINADQPGCEEMEPVFTMLSRTCYTLQELQERPLPEGVDPAKIEMYLCDKDFQETLSMSKDDFKVLPSWKKTSLKRSQACFNESGCGEA